MQLIYFLYLLVGVFAFSFNIYGILAERKCDKFGVLIYEDMGCRAIANDACTACPKEFSCPNLKTSKDQCYYQNMTYKIGDVVPDQYCDIGCICSNGGKLFCAIIDCAEYFGLTPPPGCYNTYDLEHCCSSGQECGKSKVTCEYDGQIYKEGQKFYPKKSCSMCVCQKGFRGKLEAPFCTRSKCNVQLKTYNKSQQRCAPLYRSESSLQNGILCCPSEWICPDGTEQVTGISKSDKVCYFGGKTLRLGQTIEKTMELSPLNPIICECKVPPLLTCIPQKYYPFNN